MFHGGMLEFPSTHGSCQPILLQAGFQLILLRCIGPAEILRALTVARFSRMNVSLAHFCQGFRGKGGREGLRKDTNKHG